jgi:hypothetical protein
MIFVFGSNMRGRHGAGAALYAKRHHGAIYGQPEGRQGDSYGIPTKDEYLVPLPLHVIYAGVDRFMDYALANIVERFKVTRIGCGLAGFKNENIAPMFMGAPDNCLFDAEWLPYLHTGAAAWLEA